MTMIDPIELAKRLIACPSITPASGRVFDELEEALLPLGFDVHRFVVGEAPDGPVENMVATRGSGSPHFGFAGHLDVVPPGDGWATDPFAPVIEDGDLIGRGDGLVEQRENDGVERLPGIATGRGDRRAPRLLELLRDGIEGGEQQLVLRAEMEGDRAGRNVGEARHLLHGREREPFLGNDAHGGVQNLPPPLGLRKVMAGGRARPRGDRHRSAATAICPNACCLAVARGSHGGGSEFVPVKLTDHTFSDWSKLCQVN